MAADVSRETFGPRWLEEQDHLRRRQAAYETNKKPGWMEKLFDPSAAYADAPSTREQVAGGIDWLNRNYGPKEWNRFDNTSKGLADDLTSTLENTTPLGGVTGYEDAKKLAREGRGGLAALVGGASLAGFVFPAGRIARGMEDTAPGLAGLLAKKLEAGGASPDDVFKQTGYFRDAGNDWLYEYGDQGMKAKPDSPNYAAASDKGGRAVIFDQARPKMAGDMDPGLEPPNLIRARESWQSGFNDDKQLSLFDDQGRDVAKANYAAEDSLKKRGENRGRDPTFGEIFDHPLQRQYNPEVTDTPVRLQTNAPPRGMHYEGFYQPTTNRIDAKGAPGSAQNIPNGAESVALHEATHRAQHFQDMPGGANTTLGGSEELGGEVVRRARQKQAALTGLEWKMHDNILDKGGSPKEAMLGSAFHPDVQDAKQQIEPWAKEAENLGYKGYQADEGEAMARLAQERATWDPKFQGDRHPFRDLDIHPDLMFARNTNGGQVGGQDWEAKHSSMFGSFPDRGNFDWLLPGGEKKIPTPDEVRGPVSYYGRAAWNEGPSAAPNPLKHPISKVNLSRPLDQMERTVEEGAPLVPRRDIEWDKDLKPGGWITSLYGDRTQAGKTLTGINGEPLPRGVPLEGGSDYMRSPDGPVWASDKGIITRLDNRVQKLAEGGDPVYGAYTAMGSAGGDFSTMQSQAMLDQLLARQKDLDPALKAKFDAQMTEATRGNWPGIERMADEGPDAWMKSAPGKHRGFVSKLMDAAPYQRGGFPDVAAARAAITDPDLLLKPNLWSGRNIAELTPGTAQPGKHGTYGTDFMGRYIGSAGDEGMPWDVLFRDFAKSRPPGEAVPNTGYTIQTAGADQRVDQQLIDALMEREMRLRTERSNALGR